MEYGTEMDLTLLGFDIYLYADSVEENEVTIMSSLNQVEFQNDSSDSILDKGKLVIEVMSGSYDSITLKTHLGEVTLVTPMPEGSRLELDLQNNSFKKNGSVSLVPGVIDFEPSTLNTLSLVFSGSGVHKTTYTYKEPITNEEDIMFLTNVSQDLQRELIRKTNVKSKQKIIKTAKTDCNFGIDFIWNGEEESKLSEGLYRFRLEDEYGNRIKTLHNARIDSISYGGGEDSNYTCSMTGMCEEIK